MFPTTALVTGGASGIGAAIAALLHDSGSTVEILDLVHGFDVSDPAAWEAVGPVELAVLNAGVATGERDIASLSDAAYRRTVSVNVDGVVLGARHMARVMRPGGVIVATASLAGLVPMASDPIYTLTKHAVVGFVRSVAPQLEQRGIRICAVAPGIVDTALIGSSRQALVEAGFPLLSPGEVARAALAAARDAECGAIWAVQPGRQPEPMRVGGVPGPRDASGASVGAPPGA
ncbi:MAG TPA: SDR family NAD(P)-dependent oxidoreductase [Acidimicrobiales bacterium]|nr:SDR family NAD(P)-dependent oxidoreductase [Acidimicrobiales bacterium]